MNNKLKDMKRATLKEVFKKEKEGMSEYIASEEGIKKLSSAIEFDIEVIEKEAKSGKYYSDILAKSSDFNDSKIIIENQLWDSNHDHLGKSIVYAAQHDAKIIIWIVGGYNDEHRAAIEWLNDLSSDKDKAFYLVELQLWKIGNNDNIGINYQIIEGPNNFVKFSKVSNAEKKQLSYWEKYSQLLKDNNVKNARKPLPQLWYDIKITGINGKHITHRYNTRDNKIVIAIWIPNDKNAFEILKEPFIEKFGDKFKNLLIKSKESNDSSQLGWEIPITKSDTDETLCKKHYEGYLLLNEFLNETKGLIN